MVTNWSCKSHGRDLKLLSICQPSVKLSGQDRVAGWGQLNSPRGVWTETDKFDMTKDRGKGERWGTSSQIAGARARLSIHGCMAPQVWAGRPERCQRGKVWLGDRWRSHRVFKARAKSLLWENKREQQRIRGAIRRHKQGSARVRMWRKRRDVRHTKEGKWLSIWTAKAQTESCLWHEGLCYVQRKRKNRTTMTEVR